MKLARNFGFLACHENYTIFRTSQVKPRFIRGGDWVDTSCVTCKCNTCKMNENGGIYGGCLDCEDCKEQDLHCEDCSMYEYDKYRLSN